MRLAGIAGLVAMLVFVLPASAGRSETGLERQIRAYLEPSQRYRQIFGLPDDTHLGLLDCGTAGQDDELVCNIGFGKELGFRYLVSSGPHRTFDFESCPYPDVRDMAPYNYEDNPCSDEIDRG
jgi:hypothetical protein